MDKKYNFEELENYYVTDNEVGQISFKQLTDFHCEVAPARKAMLSGFDKPLTLVYIIGTFEEIFYRGIKQWK